jgi:hypothetical protein
MRQRHALIKYTEASQCTFRSRQETLADAESRELAAINHEDLEAFARHVDRGSTASGAGTNH